MATPIKINRSSKLVIALIALCIICIFSCNSSSSSGDKKDTTAAPQDTSMKMTDSSKPKMSTDTTRGGQQPPTKP